LRTPRRLWSLAPVLAMLIASCTSTEPEPNHPLASEAAEAFAQSWTEGDFDAMAESLRAASGQHWTPIRLERYLGRQLERGRVTTYEVTVAGDVAEPDDAAFESAEESGGEEVSVEVPYEIRYGSEAASHDVLLGGHLQFRFDAGEDQWIAEWDNGLLWPGITGAERFDVTYRWPPRAAILDRKGRRLAVGSAGRRRYPFGSIGGSIVGHLEPLNRADAAEHELADVGDLVGGSGLEEGLNERLAGRPASKLMVLDGGGDPLEVLGRMPAEPGRPVKTTLDINVQRAAESAYGDTAGGVALVDPATGGILAAVASGPFDPNNYVGVEGVNPFNRALVGLYPPGSAMKVATAAAALEERVVTPSSAVTGPKEYKGVRNFESGVYNSIPFSSAVKYSVNTAFAQVAEDLGAKRMTRYAEAFGFNRTSDMPLEVAESSFPPPEGLGDLMWASIGQAQVLSTPLQMATVAATIANRGKRMEPRVEKDARPVGERAVSRRTAAQVTAMMEDVVEGGTGIAARISGLSVAGKTGTAEVDVNGKRKEHAWFIAFAPVEQPVVAIAVVAELGGVGGRVAAPLARQILISTLPYLR
jgi:peptidoglycan glycosyltransferase